MKVVVIINLVTEAYIIWFIKVLSHFKAQIQTFLKTPNMLQYNILM